MPAFSNGKKEPEPGRPIVRHEVIKETHTEQQNIDVGALAKAVAEALGKMPGRTVYRSDNGDKIEDDFDNSKTLERLADSMVNNNKKQDSKIDEVGIIKSIKKNNKDVDGTVDILSNLE